MAKIKTKLKQIMKEGKGKYLIVVTGHQGEPKSALSKMANGMFDFRPGDHVVFSSTIIPTPTSQKNRAILDDKFRALGVRMFKDIHVSGHAAREDQRDLIEMLRPKQIIPAHGERIMTSALGELTSKLGYNKKDVHVMKNGEKIRIV